MRSPSPAFSSDIASPPSTAPSTPPPGRPTYCIVTHDASIAFLQTLPVTKSSGDRALLISGAGAVKELLSQAADILEDKSILEDARWERVIAQDGSVEVEYYQTKSGRSMLEVSDEKATIVLDAVKLQTKPVSFLPSHFVH